MRSYDVENQAYNLSDLTEGSDGEPGPTYKRSQDTERTVRQPTKLAQS